VERMPVDEKEISGHCERGRWARWGKIDIWVVFIKRECEIRRSGSVVQHGETIKHEACVKIRI
jgi:hypothetical protein